MAYIMIKINEQKKAEFQKAIEAKEPNLNMSAIIKNFIDDYIKKTK